MKKIQKLSKRLQAAADFVAQGSRAADIGTDHGFLPIYLVQSGRCPQVIAMDIRKGPLKRAQEHIQAAGLEDVIQTRLSDGMRELAKNEAESVVITGMGGLTVIHILQEAKHLLPDLKELILEPQSDLAKVRTYLRVNQMYTDREELVCESGKFYPILHVSMDKPEPSQMRQTEKGQIRKILLEKLGDEERLCRLLDQYGECMVYGRHPVFGQMLKRDEKRELGILRELAKGVQTADGQNAGKAETVFLRKKEVENRLEEIRVLLEVGVYEGNPYTERYSPMEMKDIIMKDLL